MKFWCKFESSCHLVSFQFYSDCAPDLTWIKVLINGLRLKGTLAMNYEVKKQMVDGQRKQLRSTEKACPEEMFVLFWLGFVFRVNTVNEYASFDLKEMLKDVVRTKTYLNVIYKNKFLFKEKIVLDVGARTGILSLFCAKAGAKHVYAIECSQMADMAPEIVEEIDLPVPQVDVIILEWMGYFLLYENMLNTVLYARDKWLVSDGIVLPDNATLHLTAIEDAEYKEDKIKFWKNVYGFDMCCIRKQSMMEPLVDTVDQNQISMNISEMTSGDASFTAPFKLVAERDDYIHALVAYFDVAFTICNKMTGFSTGEIIGSCCREVSRVSRNDISSRKAVKGPASSNGVDGVIVKSKSLNVSRTRFMMLLTFLVSLPVSATWTLDCLEVAKWVGWSGWLTFLLLGTCGMSKLKVC
ncbi:putative methyltransferase [Helianthus annuus]|nr:putative methyltransferase [Helianthus annuus]KAJ0625442.1 putative methyltransferase [Helianthus annuus]KAJ0781859.1 putative methyltransferase [Helianthus annuus]